MLKNTQGVHFPSPTGGAGGGRNISSSSVYQKRFDYGGAPGGPLIFYNYKYDQLNRLTGQDAYNNFNVAGNHWNSMTAMGGYLKERISYDANGNILKYLRNSISGATPNMDSLTYYYNAGTNRLKHVKDSLPAGTYTSEQDNLIKDISTQPNNNYCYDAIGNLIKDSAEKITSIKWNVYGKITEINRIATADVPTTKIQYSYDAAGNRISQITTTGDNKYYTWYVRDAQGNLLTTYSATGTNSDLDELQLQQSEKYMYGSSRLGVVRVAEDVDNDNAGPGSMQYYDGNGFDRGGKAYELTNHLGNVLATISDRKFPVPSVSNSSLIDHYDPHIVNAQDYYPFGMLSRVALPNNGQTYRFGFNGQEMNNDAKGLGNSYTAQYWEYDSRLGRRWNLDPRPTVGVSEYSAFNNNPIWSSDPLGDTIKIYSTAEVTHTTLTEKGGTFDLAINRITFKDALLVPAVNKEGKLFGYHVFDTKDNNHRLPILQIEPGDVEEFKRGYDWYMGGARWVYSAGEPSEGMKMMGAGLATQDVGLMWKGVKKENKDAWSNPVYVASLLTSFAHAGIEINQNAITVRLQSYVTRAAKEVDALGDAAFTQKQLRAIHRHPRLRAMYRGNRIDVRARRYAANDPALSHLKSNYTRGADFVDPHTGNWWDITTPEQWDAHVRKYGPGGTLLRTR